MKRYDQILEKLAEFETYWLTTHPNPDGDALGSTIALYHLLTNTHKKAYCILHGGLDPKISFLLKDVPYLFFPSLPKDPPDCLIILDVGDKKRVGKLLKELPSKVFLINIDHHVSNQGFGHIDLLEPWMSSCGEIIYHLFRRGEIFITPPMATALFTAISTDTGFFTFSNTTPSALKAAGELLEMGANLSHVVKTILRSKPFSLFQLEVKYLSELSFSKNRHIVWGSLLLETIRQYQLTPAQVADFVEIPRTLNDVDISILFREESDKQVKVSLRSNHPQLDMNQFAQKFGGGGHARAAGCIIEGSLQEVEEKVTTQMKLFYKEHTGQEP